jgi:GDPmannose 4,6-dehydratase
MSLMLKQVNAQDFVIATGESNSLTEFVAEAFNCLGLEGRDHVTSDPTLMRPTDLRVSRANPSLAAKILGWSAKSCMRDVVRAMVLGEQQKNSYKI